MIIASQILSVIITILTRLQKTKAKALICICLSNLIAILTYFLLDQVAGVFLSTATLIRTIIFFLYDHYNIKPNIYVLLTFEVSFIIIAGITWKSPVDSFILLSIFMFTFVSWQDNMYILRIGMILDPVILIIYNSLIGAYISILGQVISLIVAIIAIIYYDIYKRTTPIIKRLLYYVKPKRKRKRLRLRLRKRRA